MSELAVVTSDEFENYLKGIDFKFDPELGLSAELYPHSRLYLDDNYTGKSIGWQAQVIADFVRNGVKNIRLVGTIEVHDDGQVVDKVESREFIMFGR